MNSSKNTILVVLGAVIAVVVTTLLARSRSRPEITWSDTQAFGYTVAVPADWNETGVGTRIGGRLEREQRKRSEWCDEKFHDVYLEISEYDAFSYQKHDGSLGRLLAKEDAYDYIALKKGEVIMERELANGATLVMGDGRYGSAPCIANQHLGLIVDGEKAMWILLVMDEERNDIVSHIYESLEPQESLE